MRKLVLKFGMVGAFFASVPSAQAQWSLIEFAHPFRAHNLSGVVVDTMGAPVAGVVVEDCIQTFVQARASGDVDPPVFEERMLLDCHSEPKHVLASTTTDSKGYFRFLHAKTGSTHYLYLTQTGFDPMQITVKLRLFARAGLRLNLVIAT
jgi:hypothetical protein